MAAGDFLVDAGSVLYSGANITSAGTTQGGAAAITTDTVEVTVPDITHHGVILPATPAYARVFVKNVSVILLNVYPPSGGQVDSAGVDNPVTLTNTSAIYVSTKSDNSQWTTVTVP